MANRLSDEIINKIPVLYSELQNKAAVARELGISVASVNKYLTVISGAPQEIKKEKKKRIKITDEVIKQINDETALIANALCASHTLYLPERLPQTILRLSETNLS